ncbi:MAG: methylenetetrahydrofolate reductase [Kiritimatiellae bacterium]|nr:methylenetetrahydrofolate reductase [Kiritimatiellia bacterium]
MKSGSRLEQLLSRGEFVVTAEMGPPMSADAGAIMKKTDFLRGTADAFNITDNQTAVVRMSSLAASVLCLQAGLEPVMQMVCRDRNRIAMQSDILGAVALGIRNCLCLSGDHQSFGRAGKLLGHPGAKNVYDLDSINQVRMLRQLRDEHKFMGGDPVKGEVPLFIGAAWTPLGDPVEFRVIRLGKKIAAGADFIQTQGIYDVERFAEIMQKARAEGLPEKAAILAGIIIPRSAGMLKYMNNHVPGVVVPEKLIRRMSEAKDQKAEGIAIAVELIRDIRKIEGIRGVHVQPVEWESAMPAISEQAGLLPRPEAAG